MANDTARSLNAFRTLANPRRFGDNPLRLACRLDRPATEREIAEAWSNTRLPTELTAAWFTSCESRLSEDVDYGQWGLVLVSPKESAIRTVAVRTERPDAYTDGDIVIGEFLGDQELLVFASSADHDQLLVALPLDDRSDWYAVGPTLSSFLDHYLGAAGQKYWE